jgi:hypothetical protein
VSKIRRLRATFREWHGVDVDAMPEWQLEQLDAATWRIAKRLARRELAARRERNKLAKQGCCN